MTTTANHYGYALIDDTPQRCVINMTGSQLKHSRSWNTLIQGTKLPGAKGAYTPPAYSHWYSLKTQVESNDRGSWYSYNITQERVLEEKEIDLLKRPKNSLSFVPMEEWTSYLVRRPPQ